ncbi:long-chain-acyl-CoA synthetase [Rhodococcoides corynebacterioides]|uniref:Long-chain-acyl-CoA synthetase n=1 Tax=Rhodococcoides corynebacterioides TaxID=53972 RepID=A0ABS7NZT3_9NOCA|nr:long-chain-acyl-CoA synthetase [Rhodococcus corynebacterioides]MBY6365653.1 long-chain-acyl-CoA synthetase [Rhodococcus corynebacterioides]MBY6406384.1 long-chain-acyl-CoA synthetase [Rhodococcus corynebacterioides]
MAAEARHKVGLLDLATATAKMAPALPTVLRGVPGFLRKPTDKESIGFIFQRAAAKHPDRPFVRFEGDTLTYGQANDLVNRYASVLVDRGVRRGDVVGVLAKNSMRTLLVALAAVKLGATAGMLNFNQRGEVLDHSLGILDARVLVVDEDCLEALDSLDEALPEKVVLHADELDRLAESASAENPAVTAEIQAKEKAFYIFTSGTTGMPKASLMSHFRWLKSMSGLGSMGVRLRGDDVLYCCLPLYHNNALTVSLSSVLASGAAIAIGKQFSVSRFWDDVRANEATAFTYIGELCRYLLTQDEKPSDKDNSIRLIVGNGLRPEIWHEFTERFGISRVAEFYGASECNIAFINAFNLDRTAGFCPLPYAVVEYDDETGKAKRDGNGRLTKVPAGGVGLLLSKITDRAPFDGYSDEDATKKKLLENGFKDGDCWFDTGDLVRQQGFRHVAFVDRLGDTFRWKGENVATTQVEGALGSHPDVDQAVVFGVDIPGADGKAGMAAVTLRNGKKFDGASLATHAYESLPAYAVPLFVRVVDSLEATSTFKSKKVELRKTGYGDGDGDLYVLKGKADGYVESYDGYVDEVGGGKLPKG